LQKLWESKFNNESIKLALQDDYLLLDKLGDDLGKRFINLKLGWNRRESPLSARNESILAHGFNPIKKKATFDNLLEILFELSGAQKEDLPMFPKIKCVS